LIRGEIWTAAGGPDYAGKPRPVVIIQADRFDATASITVCGMTTTELAITLFRVGVEPTPSNGLAQRSFIMVDKIASVRRDRLRRRIGRLAVADVASLDRAIATFLGLAG
jgi:mRNA interferase MazF